jgi:AcrR family transcriptional regulator
VRLSPRRHALLVIEGGRGCEIDLVEQCLNGLAAATRPQLAYVGDGRFGLDGDSPPASSAARPADAMLAAPSYCIKSAAGTGGSATDQISSAKSLLDSGAIPQKEFSALKAKHLAARTPEFGRGSRVMAGTVKDGADIAVLAKALPMPRFHVIIHDMESVAPRPYRMGVRAQSAEETGERILDAAADVFWERPSDQISLDEVALRAGVTVRTVIRRFGGKQGLLAAAAAREMQRERGDRALAPVGDAPTAVAVLVENYEATGDRVLRMLAEEPRVPGLTPFVDLGRALHRTWCARVFAPALAGLSGVERQRRLAQLAAICDVYTWKLLRVDSGLSRRQTELALVEMLAPLMEER